MKLSTFIVEWTRLPTVLNIRRNVALLIRWEHLTIIEIAGSDSGFRNQL
jgi:hypothetical protein